MKYPNAHKAKIKGYAVVKSNSGLGYNQYVTLLVLEKEGDYIILDSDAPDIYPEGSLEQYDNYEIEKF